MLQSPEGADTQCFGAVRAVEISRVDDIRIGGLEQLVVGVAGAEYHASGEEHSGAAKVEHI